jgi:hypothetical protein
LFLARGRCAIRTHFLAIVMYSHLKGFFVTSTLLRLQRLLHEHAVASDRAPQP